jgi:protocatechuate 3,4-dioxygenase beta subunit
LLAAAVLFSVAACTTTQQLIYTGRVVDGRGTPVPHAGLLISSMDKRGLEGIMQGWDADADGNFTFKFPEKVCYISAWSPDSKLKGELDFPPQKDSVIVVR